MRITIDEDGQIIERVCANCPRTLPAQGGDLCGRCSPEQSQTVLAPATRKLVGDWMQRAGNLIMSAKEPFESGNHRVMLSLCDNFSSAATAFAETPWPINIADTSIPDLYEDDSRLFDAAIRFAIYRNECSTEWLVLELWNWFCEMNRRLEREERSHFECN